MFTDRLGQCRHCTHPRKAHHRAAGEASACTGTLSCKCRGFAPSSPTWVVVEADDVGRWDVVCLSDGTAAFRDLPSQAAAVELAQTLTDIDDMLAVVQVIACAR